MPRLPVDYSKTIMYKLVCNDLTITDVYVGHTTDFRKRKNSHKSNCCNINSNTYHLKVYQIIRANGNWESWTMVQIEQYPCLNVYEAGARERYWFEELNSKLNTRVPNRSDTESSKIYRETHEHAIKINLKNTKEHRKERDRLYYEKNKERIINRQMKYYANHKDHILVQAKDRYQTNK